MNTTTKNTNLPTENVQKTVLDWFNLLPKDIKEKALAYIYAHYYFLLNKTKKWVDDMVLNAKTNSLKTAIFISFDLASTNEGFDYWYNVIKVHGTTEN